MFKTIKNLIWIIVLSLFAQHYAIRQSFAQSLSNNSGLSYLQSAQTSDGYWGDVTEVGYNTVIDTATVADTLKSLGETGEVC